MIKIGPVVERYATAFNVPPQEVVEWMNAYITGPWPSALEPHLERTESEREASVKAYVKREVDIYDLSMLAVGLNDRMAASLKERRLAQQEGL